MSSDMDDDDLEQEAIEKMKDLMNLCPKTARDEDIKTILQRLSGQINKTDKLYPVLKKKLIGSSYDAKHVKRILQLSASTAKRINSTAKDFSLKDKIVKLKRTHRSELAKHLALEYASGDFCRAPTFEFFYGAIPLEGLVIKERKRRARIDLAEQNSTTQTKATERDLRDECEQDSTPKEVDAIYNRVKSLTARQPRGADFLSTVVDAKSFPRTVENLFHFSFLVREGRVSIVDGDSKKPVMKTVEESDTNRQWNQSVMSFSMAEYKKWTRKD